MCMAIQLVDPLARSGAHSHSIETVAVFVVFLRRADWKVLVVLAHVLSPNFVAPNIE